MFCSRHKVLRLDKGFMVSRGHKDLCSAANYGALCLVGGHCSVFSNRAHYCVFGAYIKALYSKTEYNARSPLEGTEMREGLSHRSLLCLDSVISCVFGEWLLF